MKVVGFSIFSISLSFLTSFVATTFLEPEFKVHLAIHEGQIDIHSGNLKYVVITHTDRTFA